jgi:hypothetical protein
MGGYSIVLNISDTLIHRNETSSLFVNHLSILKVMYMPTLLLYTCSFGAHTEHFLPLISSPLAMIHRL